MRSAIYGSLIGLSCVAAALAANPGDKLAATGVSAPPPTAPLSAVTETLWGQKITDAYRGMEALDPATLGWMKAQGDYTRSVLDAIKPRAALADRVASFTASYGAFEGSWPSAAAPSMRSARPGRIIST